MRPIALEKYPVFCENCREITYMQTSSFGFAAQIEVGAMLVGKIANKVTSGAFSRGQEKGMFLYGGSTVIVLLRKDAAEFDEGLFASTADGFEIPVVQGMRISPAVSPKRSEPSRERLRLLFRSEPPTGRFFFSPAPFFAEM